jgi:hypothetical protein
MIREVDAQKRERCRSGRFSPRQHETFSGKLSHVDVPVASAIYPKCPKVSNAANPTLELAVNVAQD